MAGRDEAECALISAWINPMVMRFRIWSAIVHYVPIEQSEVNENKFFSFLNYLKHYTNFDFIV